MRNKSKVKTKLILNLQQIWVQVNKNSKKVRLSQINRQMRLKLNNNTK